MCREINHLLRNSICLAIKCNLICTLLRPNKDRNVVSPCPFNHRKEEGSSVIESLLRVINHPAVEERRTCLRIKIVARRDEATTSG